MWIYCKDKCKQTPCAKCNFPWLTFIALRLFGVLIESYEVWICCCRIYHTLPTASTYLVGWFFYCKMFDLFHKNYEEARHWICWQVVVWRQLCGLNNSKHSRNSLYRSFSPCFTKWNSTSGNNEERVPNFCFTDKQHPEHSLKDCQTEKYKSLLVRFEFPFCLSLKSLRI